jgi:hypothetical protein
MQTLVHFFLVAEMSGPRFYEYGGIIVCRGSGLSNFGPQSGDGAGQEVEGTF